MKHNKQLILMEYVINNLIIVGEYKMNQIFKRIPTLEGAGVHLHRIFGYHEVPLFDPFLLLDHFGSNNPDDYIKGFPWHPHRGIETVTYMLTGEVEHGDSIGNKGIISSGDVQWMTAGGGIIHQEMPIKYEGLMQGFQLWINLPANQKMMKPRYRDITKQDIPIIKESGKEIKIIAGEYHDIKGPVSDLIVDVVYYDITLNNNSKFSYQTKDDYTTFSYLINGSGIFNNTQVKTHNCILFDKGHNVDVKSTKNLRFLLISGQPLYESVAWGGPIVMNTQEELQKAFKDLDNGTFIRQTKPIHSSKDYYKE